MAAGTPPSLSFKRLTHEIKIIKKATISDKTSRKRSRNGIIKKNIYSHL